MIHESAPGGMRKIRGPNHQLAAPKVQRDGSTLLQSADGTTYKTRPMK